MLKRIISFVVTAAMILSMICAIPVSAAGTAEPEDADVIFNMDQVSGKPGDTVYAGLYIDSKVNINTVGVYLVNYPSDVMTFAGFENPGAIVVDSMLKSEGVDSEKGIVTFGYMEASQYSGKICDLKFVINGDAQETNAEIQMDAIVKHGNNILQTYVQTGTVSIKTYKLGDLNGDEIINISDAVLLLQYSVFPEFYPLNYSRNVDFNHDGSIDIGDAVLLLQHSIFPEFYPINDDPITYKVTYNANGGSGAPSEQDKTQGNPLTISSALPTKSHSIFFDANGGVVSPASKNVNCTFMNWNTESNGSGTTYSPGETYNLNSSVTLYAQWTDPSAGDLTTPTRSNYTFTGWYTAPTGGSQITSATTITGDTTVYAQWNYVPAQYTISYNANGGTGVPAAQTKIEGQPLTLSSTLPTKSYTITYHPNGGAVATLSKDVNCEFKNWNTQSNGGGSIYNPGGTYYLNSSVTLYAQWTNPTAGSLTTPIRSNYTFTGWYTAAGGGSKVTSTTAITGDITVYAHWEYVPTEYTVSYSATGGTGAPAAQTKTEGQPLTLSTTVPTKSYTIDYEYGDIFEAACGDMLYQSRNYVSCTFNNWNTQSSGVGTTYYPGGTYNLDSNVTLYAQWTNPKADIQPEPTLTDNSFLGWYTAPIGGSQFTSDTVVTGDITVYAHWDNGYVVSYDANGGTGAPAAQTKIVDQPLTLSTTVPTKSCTIDYEYGDIFEAACGDMLYQSREYVSCTFNNWNTQPNGSGTTYYPGGSYSLNSNATLYAQWINMTTAAQPEPTLTDYLFRGWYTAPIGGSKFTSATVVTGDITVYAHWDYAPYKVSYNANGGTGAPATQQKVVDQPLTLSTTRPTKSYSIYFDANGGSVSPAYSTVNCTFENWNTQSNGSGTTYYPGGTYNLNSSVTLYARWTNPTAGSLRTPTRSKYTFDGWYTAPSGGSQVTSTTTITGDTTVYAHWTYAPNQYTVSYNANGGTGAPSAQTKTEGQSLTLSTTRPTKSFTITFKPNGGTVSSSSKGVYCIFKNWNTQSNGNGTTYNPGGTYTANSSVTLYAQWTNPTADVLPQPTRDEYTFDGWYTSASGGSKVTSATTVLSNMTVYAHWTPIYALTKEEQFSFANSQKNFPRSNKSGKYMLRSDIEKLCGYVSQIYSYDLGYAAKIHNYLLNYKAAEWKGSCFGMSSITILDKLGYLSFYEYFDSTATSLSGVRSPAVLSGYDSERLESAINYYQISQEIPYIHDTNCISIDKYDKYGRLTQAWSDGLEGLVNKVSEGVKKPILFSYWFDGGAHAIVIKGYQTATNGSHNLIAYDNRYPDRDIIVNISGTSCTVNNTEVARKIEYVENMNAFNSISITGMPNYQSSAAIDYAETGEYDAFDSVNAVENLTRITVPINGTLTIENAEGEMLTLDDGVYSGTMDVIRTSLIVNSTVTGGDLSEITFTVSDSDSYVFSSESNEIDVSVLNREIFGYAKTSGAHYVVISKQDGIDVLGDDYDYSLSLSVNNEICDMVTISGHADNDVSLSKTEDAVTATGVDDESGLVTVYSNIVDVDLYSYEEGYGTIEITAPEDETEGVEIRGSSAGNEDFDVSIGVLLADPSTDFNPDEVFDESMMLAGFADPEEIMTGTTETDSFRAAIADGNRESVKPVEKTFEQNVRMYKKRERRFR